MVAGRIFGCLGLRDVGSNCGRCSRVIGVAGGGRLDVGEELWCMA